MDLLPMIKNSKIAVNHQNLHFKVLKKMTEKQLVYRSNKPIVPPTQSLS